MANEMRWRRPKRIAISLPQMLAGMPRDQLLILIEDQFMPGRPAQIEKARDATGDIVYGELGTGHYCVAVVEADRRSQGVGNIWADEAQERSTEAATRAIVTAGDSVTRALASRAAAARRAAADSTRQAERREEALHVIDAGK